MLASITSIYYRVPNHQHSIYNTQEICTQPYYYILPYNMFIYIFGSVALRPVSLTKIRARKLSCNQPSGYEELRY
jgi:hypothetical protein